MPNKLQVSQIFLPNPKHALNYVSVYEEGVRSDQSVSIFVVLEIRGERKSPASRKEEEFDQLAQTIARSVKNTYLAETRVTEMTFEKALSNVNTELSNLARRGIVGWYKKLHALIGVFSKSTLSVSVTGSASAFLLRGREFTHISENLSSGDRPHPLKTFVNFATGSLAEQDVIVLSTPALFNYLSLEKLRQVLESQTLDQATRELIASLKTDAPAMEAFAAFICLVNSRLRLSDTELQPLMTPASHTIIEDRQNLQSSQLQRLVRSLQALPQGLMKIVRLLGSALALLALPGRSKRNTNAEHRPPRARLSRKGFLIFFLAVALLLVASVIAANFRNSRERTSEEMRAIFDQASQRTTDAEAALIYGDQQRALAAITEAASQIAKVNAIGLFPDETNKLTEKINRLSAQLNKVTRIDRFEQLGSFTNTPTQLIKTQNGFVGFNAIADSFEHFDMQSGKTATIQLNTPITENLVAGVWLPQRNVVELMSQQGNFYELNLAANSLVGAAATTSLAQSDWSLTGLRLYQGKAYSVDAGHSQIVRFSAADRGFEQGQNWLRQPAELADAQSIAVDGAVWVLLPDQVLKFVKGTAQSFSIPVLTDPLREAKVIVTDADHELLYLADTKAGRIVILNKQGGLVVQLVSDRFTDLKDMWVDERGKLMYVLAGNDLLRFKY